MSLLQIEKEESKERPYTFLSFGGGIQTIALLVGNFVEYDEVIFADTGGEWPETYSYIQNHVLPFVKKKGIKFTVVRNKNWQSLEDYCVKTKHFPSWHYRWCTRDFKVRPICQYLRKTLSKEKIPARAIMGISSDEEWRTRKGPPPKEYSYWYPLCEQFISRGDCQKAILAVGLPLPPKSACTYCPYMNLVQLRTLHDKHGDLWQNRIEMEEKSRAFPRAHISPYGTTRQLGEFFEGKGNHKIDEFLIGPSCDSGHCFT